MFDATDVQHLMTKRTEAAAAAVLGGVVAVGSFALSWDPLLSVVAGAGGFLFAFFGLLAAETMPFFAPSRPAPASEMVRELASDLSKKASAAAGKAAAAAETAVEAARPAPAALDRPADDLKQIKGVGPKLEAMLHAMDVRHFDQIASWGPAQVAWMDANLEGFKGRVTRDDWVAQAKILAAGGETEFSERVERGEVPTSQG
jgi:predicted flap endonuclease-1-like 5' DNA nuclease